MRPTQLQSLMAECVSLATTSWVCHSARLEVLYLRTLDAYELQIKLNRLQGFLNENFFKINVAIFSPYSLPLGRTLKERARERKMRLNCFTILRLHEKFLGGIGQR